MADTKAELVKTEPTALATTAMPDFIEQGERTGTEHLTQDDIQMPRLAIAQQMSPELDPTDPKYIEGLTVGTLFNSLTQQIYGTGPIEFCVLRADPPIWIEFGPDGKTIVDRNVPANDPRTQFVGTQKPAAMKFYNFVIMLLPSRELIALSLKSTGLKVAKQLNGLITFRGNVKLFAGKYSLSTVMTKNDKGRFAIYALKNAGWLPDKDTYAFAAAAFESLRHKTIQIDVDPDSFDPEDLEKQGSAPATGDVAGM